MEEGSLFQRMKNIFQAEDEKLDDGACDVLSGAQAKTDNQLVGFERNIAEAGVHDRRSRDTVDRTH